MDELMGLIGGFISAHPYWTMGLFAAYWFLSNAVAALPSPDTTSSKGYKFLFTLGHSLMGSLPRLLPWLRLPTDPSRKDPTFFGNPSQGSEPNSPGGK